MSPADSPGPDSPAAALVAAADRLVGRVTHWTPQRWSQPGRDAALSRAEIIHGLVQELADLAAAVEGRASRPVPRLENDLALPDQVRVMIADICRAPATGDDLKRAVDLVRAAARRL